MYITCSCFKKSVWHFLFLSAGGLTKLATPSLPVVVEGGSTNTSSCLAQDFQHSISAVAILLVTHPILCLQ